MNLGQLHFVHALVELGSFVKAAERCCVTQPALSNGIAQLEAELGGRIFTRTSRTVSLTSLGETILPLVKSMIESEAELRKIAQAAIDPSRTIIRLGFSPVINASIIAALLEGFRKEHPSVDFVLKECLENDLLGRLERQAVDVAFVVKGRSLRGFGSTPLYEEALYVLPRGPHDKNRSVRKPVSLAEIANDTFVTTGETCGLTGAVRSIFQKAGYQLHSYPGQALSYKVLEEWTGRGLGAGLLPESKLSISRRKARPLFESSGEPVRLRYETIWPRQAIQPPHVKVFLSFLKESAAAVITRFR